MADIFDEVSEDLRKDQYLQFWQKYKKIIILAGIIVVISLGIFKYIEHYKAEKQIRISNLYFRGIDEIRSKLYNKAENTFKEVISQSHSGFTLLSYFKLASLSLKNKDYAGMNYYYDSIIEFKSINNAYKDYASILKIANSPNYTFKQKIKLLEPFTTSPNDFQPIASELEILYLFELNENKKAKVQLEKLINQKNILSSQKNRLNAIYEIYFN